MRTLLFFLILVSCAHKPKEKTYLDDEVSVQVALDQARASYLRGCTEAFKEIGMSPSFEHCVKKAQAHREEINGIIRD